MKLHTTLLLLSLSYSLATPLYPDVVRIQNNSRRAIRVYHGPSTKMPHISSELIIGGIEVPPTTSFNFEYTPAEYGSPSQPDTLFMIEDRLFRKKDGFTIGKRAQFNLPACQGGLLITFNAGESPHGATTQLSTHPKVPLNLVFANFSSGTLFGYLELTTRGE